MIEGNDIIVFANDWDGDPLSKKHIVERLATRNRILWVDSLGNRNMTASSRDLHRAARKLAQFARGTRTVAGNIEVFSPVVIPFHGNLLARWMNRRLLTWSLRRVCRQLGFHQPITWSFVPTSVDVVGTLGERTIIYHCVDEFSRFAGADANLIHHMERRLMRKADLVIVSASRLYETKHYFNPNTVLITHGVDVQHFRRACGPPLPPPPGLPVTRGPVIGFFGLIAEWVDLEAIRSIAAARPEWSIVLVGELQANAEELRKLPNVYFPGRQPYETLPAYCQRFDIAILPFVDNELTRAANPLKLREYLAAGLPVVASPLPEVVKLGHLVRLAAGPAEFIAHIEDYLLQGIRGPNLAVSFLMDSESWDRKVEEMSASVDGAIRRAAA